MTTETSIPFCSNTAFKLTEPTEGSVRGAGRSVRSARVDLRRDRGLQLRALRCCAASTRSTGRRRRPGDRRRQRRRGARDRTRPRRERRSEVVRPGENVGYAAGCNLGARDARGDVLLFLNPDTVVEPGAVAELARTVRRSGGSARRWEGCSCSPIPTTLNSRGAVIHIAGLGWSAGHGEPAEHGHATGTEITYANGSVLAMRRELFEQLGGFTEELFLYHEDLELGWRARMRGPRIVLNPGGRRAARLRARAEPGEVLLHGAEPARLRRLGVLGAAAPPTRAGARGRRGRADAGLDPRGLVPGEGSGWGWCAANAGWIVASPPHASGRREPCRTGSWPGT